MGRHAKHRNTYRPHLPAWLVIVASGVWSLALAVAPAAVAAFFK